MDKLKNNLVKSKSSNSPSASKPRTKRNNKKSRSNGEIKPSMVKKRGVYVENKSTKTFISKPPDNISNKSKYPQRPAKHKQPKDVEDFISTKKLKYRSKVLNKTKNDFEDIIVFQSKKEINCTPSNYSGHSYKENISRNWSGASHRFVPNSHSAVDNDNMFRITECPESSTVVGDETNKKIYNLFVDLLQSTFNVHNVKTEFNAALESDSSKVRLEIDEAVAKKLNSVKCKNKSRVSVDTNPEPKNVFSITRCYKFKNESHNDTNYYNKVKTVNMKRRTPILNRESLFNKRKAKLRTQSIMYKDLISSDEKLSKKKRKTNFLNLLKEEISESDYTEPPNFFQALKLIAKNKIRSETSTHLNESSKKASEDGDFQCRFKRRRLLSSMSKKFNVNSKKSF